MVELIIGTYGTLCWLLFKRWKVIPVTTYTVFTAILGGVVLLLVLYILLSVFHPVSHDGRMYSAVVQIVPQVRGRVIEVPVEANVPLKQGDVLFRIDPEPFQIEVDRLKALLASKNTKFAQLSEQLAAAEAATKEAKANLLVAESTFDRQARENHESAQAQVKQVKKRHDLAKTQYERSLGLRKTGAIAQEEHDRNTTRYNALEDELQQAAAAEVITAEKLRTGSSSLEAVRQDIARLEAAEREIRLQVEAESDGVNPEVREVQARLEKARWDLEQTVVRAPSNGYVPQVILRPGQMASALLVAPLMVFVSDEKPTLVATFAQKTVSDIKPGLEGEVIFKTHPGRTFKVKVLRVLTAIREGELDVSGKILTGTPEDSHGDVPVVFEYGDDVVALNVPIGTQASITIYTDRVHVLSIVRKIILRMKSWENYVF